MQKIYFLNTSIQRNSVDLVKQYRVCVLKLINKCSKKIMTSSELCIVRCSKYTGQLDTMRYTDISST